MREVFSYRFKDTPRYDYLRNLLQDLISQNEIDTKQQAEITIVKQQTQYSEMQSKHSTTDSGSSLSSDRNNTRSCSNNSYDFDVNTI